MWPSLLRAIASPTVHEEFRWRELLDVEDGDSSDVVPWGDVLPAVLPLTMRKLLVELLRPRLLRGLGLHEEDSEFLELLRAVEAECSDAMLRDALTDAELFLELVSTGNSSVAWALAMTKLRQRLLLLLSAPVEDSWALLRVAIESRFKPDVVKIQIAPNAEHAFLVGLVGSTAAGQRPLPTEVGGPSAPRGSRGTSIEELRTPRNALSSAFAPFTPRGAPVFAFTPRGSRATSRSRASRASSLEEASPRRAADSTFAVSQGLDVLGDMARARPSGYYEGATPRGAAPPGLISRPESSLSIISSLDESSTSVNAVLKHRYKRRLMPRLKELELDWDEVLRGLQRLHASLEMEQPTSLALELDSIVSPTRMVRLALLELLRSRLAQIVRLPEHGNDMGVLLSKVDDSCTDEILCAAQVNVELVLHAVQKKQS